MFQNKFTFQEENQLKKVLAVVLTGSLLLTGCGGGSSSSAVEAPSSVAESSVVASDLSKVAESSASDIASVLDALGDVDVEKELFDVTITIPSDYMEGATQEDLDAKASEIGYKVTLNDDGSATYVMTKKQHKDMMDGISDSIKSSLNEMVGSEDYPNVTGISANDDFTVFTITTRNTEPDMNESFAVMALYMYGGMYHIFNGTTVDNIHVDYVNADSGEIISSADSKDME